MTGDIGALSQVVGAFRAARKNHYMLLCLARVSRFSMSTIVCLAFSLSRLFIFICLTCLFLPLNHSPHFISFHFRRIIFGWISRRVAVDRRLAWQLCRTQVRHVWRAGGDCHLASVGGRGRHDAAVAQERRGDQGRLWRTLSVMAFNSSPHISWLKRMQIFYVEVNGLGVAWIFTQIDRLQLIKTRILALRLANCCDTQCTNVVSKQVESCQGRIHTQSIS